MTETKQTNIEDSKLVEYSYDGTDGQLDFSEDKLQGIIFDFTNAQEDRFKAIELFYKIKGDEIVEIINRLNQMYIFSGTKIIEKYLFKLCMESVIPSYLKIECAKSICSYQPRKDMPPLSKESIKMGHTCLDKVCQNLDGVPTPRKVEAVCLLMKYEEYKVNARNYFCKIINDQNIECDFRYKTILSLENLPIGRDNLVYFLTESAAEFIKNSSNRTSYRILASQLLIVRCKIENTLETEKILLSFTLDNDLDYNLRADAADVLLRYSSTFREQAQEIIILLGRQLGDVKTVFDNAQNVHVQEIEESVIQGLEFLASIEMLMLESVSESGKIEHMPITYEYTRIKIDKLAEDKYHESSSKSDCVDKINISLNRIYMDRALYSNYSCSLLHILLKVWTYISRHESEVTMKDRLLEELVDMSGTCSSGFASRLVNVISGFGDFNIRISWKDQIIANLTGRLNAKIKNIISTDLSVEELKQLYYLMYYEYDKSSDTKPESVEEFFEKSEKSDNMLNLEDIKAEYQNRVLCEMMIAPSAYADRKHFIKFFREHLLSIREEMYEEFCKHITDTDYDLYFRMALINYDGIY